MSTTTPYLGLVLYDATTDQAVAFATFRAVWGGTATTSNFYKIDTAISTIAGQITSLEGTRGAVRIPALFQSANFYSVTGITNFTAYTTGMTIILILDTTSNGTVTLDINSLGVKSVMKLNSAGTAINLTGSDLSVGRPYLFMYDGTRWLWVSANSADQIKIVGTSGNVVTVNSDNTLLGTTTQAGLIADTTHAATTKATPVDADEFPIADSAASFVLKRVTLAALKLAIYLGIKPAEGTMWNGKISPTVSSNNLTLALKTLAGTDPTSTDPVWVMLGGTLRTITSALSVTANAATNWCNAGAAETATKEIDFFVYLGYNTTDGVVIGFSRIPYVRQYSTFNTGSSNERYCRISNIANAAAVDPYAVIGRFAATLSAGAGYTWTVPTYTPSNLVQEPIYETRVLDFLSAITPQAGSLASIVRSEKYQVVGQSFVFDIGDNFTTQGSAPAYIQFSIPFSPSLAPSFSAVISDASVTSSNVTSSSNLLFVRKYDGNGFTLGAGRDVRMRYNAALS